MHAAEQVQAEELWAKGGAVRRKTKLQAWRSALKASKVLSALASSSATSSLVSLDGFLDRVTQTLDGIVVVLELVLVQVACGLLDFHGGIALRDDY